MDIFKTFPDPNSLLQWYSKLSNKPVYKSNAHIHTPYSFSSFENIVQIFELAVKEDIKILGINDFIVTQGYKEFFDNAIKYKIFPLFNIEFIGLIKEAGNWDQEMS